jgi:hypothetical protein
MKDVGDRLVNDEIPIAPLICDGLDPAPKSKSVISEIVEVLEETAHHVSPIAHRSDRLPVPIEIRPNVGPTLAADFWR